MPLVFDVLAAGVAVAAYGTFFAMPARMLPLPILVGMLAHGARWAAISVAGASVEVAALLACLIVGVVITPLADRMRMPFAAVAFASVVALIPGVYIFHMAEGFVQLIEAGAATARVRNIHASAVRRFTEKPALPVARRYVASGKYFWNAGIFFWRVSTFLQCLRRFLPATHDALMRLADAIGTRKYAAALGRIYPRLENISVDYAIMEPATRAGATTCVSVIPAKVGWSDIGSWSAVYDLLAAQRGANVSAGPSFTLDANGNFFWAPGKFVAAVGVHDLVLVETEDAILVCPRDRAQDVGKIVKHLEQQKLARLL